MRGKSAFWDVLWVMDKTASMRPAHYAREVLEAPPRLRSNPSASMRPAHYAREVKSVMYCGAIVKVLLQ